MIFEEEILLILAMLLLFHFLHSIDTIQFCQLSVLKQQNHLQVIQEEFYELLDVKYHNYLRYLSRYNQYRVLLLKNHSRLLNQKYLLLCMFINHTIAKTLHGAPSPLVILSGIIEEIHCFGN